MKRVLVIGGCGFIGSHVAEALLEHNYEVAVFDNLSTGSLKNIHHLPITFYHGDILSDELEQAISSFQPSQVIHLAAQISVQYSINHVSEDASINILGTIKVIELCKKYHVRSIVFSSSAAVYGHLSNVPIEIDYIAAPSSPYGYSKLVGENYLKLAEKLYGINYVILRYSNVYGPRQNVQGEGGVISIFLEKMMRNSQPVIFGDGQQTRDFIFVKDVSKANVLALSYGSSGIFHISSNIGITINHLYHMIQQICDIKTPPLYAPERVGDIKSSQLCNKETASLLGFYPEYSLEEGLVQTYLSLKQKAVHTIYEER